MFVLCLNIITPQVPVMGVRSGGCKRTQLLGRSYSVYFLHHQHYQTNWRPYLQVNDIQAFDALPVPTLGFVDSIKLVGKKLMNGNKTGYSWTHQEQQCCKSAPSTWSSSAASQHLLPAYALLTAVAGAVTDDKRQFAPHNSSTCQNKTNTNFTFFTQP